MKYFINHSTGTAYFIEKQGENEYLAGCPLSNDGTFDTEESFIVEVNAEWLAEEHIHAPESENFETLGDVWEKASKVLGLKT